MPVYEPGVAWLRGTATLTNGSTTVTTDGVITLNEILEGDRLYARDDDTILGPFEIVGGEGAELELRESFTGSTGSYPVAIDRNPITRTGAKTLRDVARILATIEDADVEAIGEIRDETVAAKEAAEALYGDLTAVQQAKTEAEEAAGDARDDAILTAQLVGQAATHADGAQSHAQAAAQSESEAAGSAGDAAISANAAALTEQNIAALTGDFTGSYDTYVFTAAGSETSLSGQDDSGKTLSYSPGTASVFKNGVKLIAGSDYSATDGTSITDLEPLDPGDVIEVQAFNLFSVIDSARRSQNLGDLADWPEAVRNLGEFDDGEALLDDTTMAYGIGPRRVNVGDLIRIRAEGQAFEVADPEASGGQHFSTAGGVVLRPPPRDPHAVPSIEALALLRPIFHDQIARVVHNRHFGYFKWRSGDVSSLVSADPYRGLWVPPASDTTGASGAWERVIEKNTFDAEWWLPESMPTNAQESINAAVKAITDPYAKFLLPRREVLVTAPVELSKGFVYEGAGEGCPINGQGGNFQVVYLMASNLRISNVSAGNVEGALPMGEPGGFHIFDGRQGGAHIADTPGTVIENVAVRDCHAFSAEMGIRAGFSMWLDDETEILRGSRDIFIENFHCDDIWRIGIELFRVEGVEVVSPVVRMAPPAVQSGFDRCSRIIGARNAALLGGRYIAADTVVCRGLSIETGHNGSAVSRNITIEGVEVDDANTFFNVGSMAENITVSNCRYVGRRDRGSVFAAISSRQTNIPTESSACRNILISGNQSTNAAQFISLEGHIYGIDVTNNTHVSNASSDARFLHAQPAAGAPTKITRAVFRNNTALVNPEMTGGVVRISGSSLDSESDFTFEGNEFNPTAGGVWNVPQSVTTKIPSVDSNKVLPDELWEQLRPAFGEDAALNNMEPLF